MKNLQQSITLELKRVSIDNLDKLEYSGCGMYSKFISVPSISDSLLVQLYPLEALPAIFLIAYYEDGTSKDFLIEDFDIEVQKIILDEFKNVLK